MSDLKMISPLLDSMTVENETSGHNGRTCYTVRNVTTGERFILKRMSVPASDNQINALILSGAYPDESSVNEYYSRVVEDIKAELAVGKKLAASGSFSGAIDYQVERKESGVGFDVYILYPLYVPLNDLLAKGALTNLRAINLGLDMCDAISACREAGYLFGNIKPENIFFMQSGKFLLGDLGLVTLQDLKYACLPEEYIGKYSAPELSDFSSSPNTTVDLYSLGMVLFRIYNGNHGPFEDEETSENMADRLRLSGKPIPTPIYADYELASIILRACAFKPEDRFQTPEEFKQTLMLYMQRNEVSDSLIVPPIVASQEPLAEDAEADAPEDEPIRMTDAEELDEDFRKSFAPDLSGAGTEDDIDPDAPVEIAPVVAAADIVDESDSFEAAPEQPADETNVEECGEENMDITDNTPEEQNIDPSQIDLDELIASVDEVVGTVPEEIKEEPAAPLSMHIEQTAPAADKYVDSAPDAPEAPPKKKVGPIIGRIIAIILLVAAIGAAVYFLLTWYFIDIKALNLDSCTIEEAVVTMTSEDDFSKFVVSCSDNYGNACNVTLVDGKYVISGLQPQTAYIVTVNAADYHALTSASTYTLNFTTPESTNVTEFTAERGETDGEAIFNIVFEGPAPAEWTVSYETASGSDTKELKTAETNFTVTDLLPNETYTLTLSAPEGIFLTGTLTTEYEVVPIIEAHDLTVSEIVDNRITVTWAPGENQPEEWTVTCEGNGDTLTETTKQTSCTFDLDSFDEEYTISVNARGMKEPAVLTLPADPIVINNLKATTNEDGSVSITWDTPVALPEGGWRVQYNTAGSYRNSFSVDAEEDTEEGSYVVLTNLIPNTEYEVSLLLIENNTDQKIFGTTKLTFTTDKAGALDDFNLDPEAPLTAENEGIALYTLPDAEEWDYSDLDDAKDSFTTTEKIAVDLDVDSVSNRDDDVVITFAIRNADGKVVNDFSEVSEWSDLWNKRHLTHEIPLPCEEGKESTPGNYTLEIYIDGKLLASIAFTISK